MRSSHGRPLEHQPALDGLRAVAVTMVLAFHLGTPGFDGGYLGVSLFFTLSGFLLTHLLVAEIERTGHIAVGSYLARRARRLLPAGLLGLLLVIVLGALGAFAPETDVRRGVWAALLQVYNWFDLASGNSYAELFVAPSPIAHYWSLAIEEQFYWLWPMALLLLVRWRRRRLAHADPAFLLLPAVTMAFVVTSIAALATAQLWSGNVAYLATWARAAEILAGALVAVMMRCGLRVELFRYAAWPALAVVVLLATVTPSGAGWAYAGGLPLYSLLSALLLVSLQSSSSARALLSTTPFVRLGAISYGLYVYHWPMIVWLSPQRMGFDGLPLGLVRVGATFALAACSYRFVEQPIRTGTRWPQARLADIRRAAPLALSGTVVVAFAAVLLPPRPPERPPAPAVLAAPADGRNPSIATPVSKAATNPTSTRAPAPVSTAPASTVPGASPATTSPLPNATSAAPASPAPSIAPSTAPVPGGPTQMAMFGDSVSAWLLRDAAFSFARTDVVIMNGTLAACDGFDGLPPRRDRRGNLLTPPADCLPWTESYPAVLATQPAPPQVAVLVLGQMPVLDHEIDGVWRHPCDGISWYTDDLSRRFGFFAERSIPVVFVLPARPGVGTDFMVPDDFVARYDCVRAELSAFLTAQGVTTIDFDERLCPPDACDATRVDGTHVRSELAPDVLNWLLDKVLAVRPSG